MEKETMVTSDMVQAVINTLQGLDIKATYENMDKLLGCLQMLGKVRDRLNAEVNDGNDHAE